MVFVRLVARGFCNVLSIAWKGQFLQKWQSTLESRRFAWSCVVLGVQSSYLSLSAMIFGTCVCILQSQLSDACRGFPSDDFLVVS